MPRTLLRWLLACLLAMLAAVAGAHPSPSSELLLDVGADVVRARITLPLDEFKLALPAAAHLPLSNAALGAYLAAHLRPVAPDGRAWLVTLREARWQLEARPGDVVVDLDLRPPAGSPVGDFDLDCNVIAHQVPSHLTLVALRVAGAAQPRMLGTLHFGRRMLTVRGADPRWWTGFGDLFKLGMLHIAEGTDHLLFLLTLLLPAALRAEKGRWQDFVGTRQLPFNLLAVVTAFTLGHSLTLILGAAGLVRVPQRPVEIAIAASILISALHAWRPLFPRREAWIAAGFGLVHGLAFADALRDLQLSGARLAAGVLAFNLGIESVQTLLMLVATPLLLLLARNAWFAQVRMSVALVAGLMAVIWIVVRTTGIPIMGMS